MKERFLENIFRYSNVFINIVLFTDLILSLPAWIYLQVQKVKKFHRSMAKFDKFSYILQFSIFFPASNLWHVIYCWKWNFIRNLNIVVACWYRKVGKRTKGFFLEGYLGTRFRLYAITRCATQILSVKPVFSTFKM